MRYVFRLSAAAKDKMDEVAPPRAHHRSAFIREAIVAFLCKAKQPLADRPHLRGRQADYKQVCAILSQEQVDAIKAVYPEVSVSVVIQAAILSELRKARYKMEDFPPKSKRPADATDQDTDADKNTNSNARKPKSTRSRP
jgi:uncharacterized protein (DUF1778 family)